MPNPGDQLRPMLASQARNFCCAQCWQPVVLLYENGGWIFRCPQVEPCTPGGMVSAAWVERERQADGLRAEQVARAYPELAPKRPPRDRVRDRRALFGDDT